MSVLHVEVRDISESDETILETPVPSVPPSIAVVVDHNCEKNDSVVAHTGIKKEVVSFLAEFMSRYSTCSRT